MIWRIVALFSVVSASSDIASRFLNWHNSGSSLPSLSLKEIPDSVQDRLDDYELQWEELPGTLARALLWDSGYVLNSNQNLMRVRTECGQGMDDIAVAYDNYITQCTTLQCGFFHRSQECNGTDLARVVRCSIEHGDAARSHSSMWAQADENLATLPDPLVFNHEWEGDDGWLIYGIHFVDEVTWGQCPSTTELIVPCVPHDRQVTNVLQWCLPQRGKVVDDWLDSFRDSLTPPPTEVPTAVPTLTPTEVPTLVPTEIPTETPTEIPTETPTEIPTETPTEVPTEIPTETPTKVPTKVPIRAPTKVPTHKPTERPITPTREPLLRTPMPDGNNDPQKNASSESGNSMVLVIVGVALALMAVVLFIVKVRRKSTDGDAITLDDESALSIRTPKAVDGTNSSGPSSTYTPISELELSSTEIIDPNEVVIVQTLGSGSFGEVYLAKFSGAYVAVKRMHQWKASTSELEREVALVKSLHHPNIVQFLGATENDMGLCSVCEYMERGDLYDVLQSEKTPLSWEMEKHMIAIDTASGLVYLHQLNPPIIHRDLKSRNILIGRHFNAKLADFGLSRQVTTDTMTITGSHLWLAPEMYRGEQYTEKADIFSFGIILAELDTRALPYQDTTFPNGERLSATAITYRVAFEGLRPSLSSTCPDFIQELFIACTQANPDQRPSAQAVLTELQTNSVV